MQKALFTLYSKYNNNNLSQNLYFCFTSVPNHLRNLIDFNILEKEHNDF